VRGARSSDSPSGCPGAHKLAERPPPPTRPRNASAAVDTAAATQPRSARFLGLAATDKKLVGNDRRAYAYINDFPRPTNADATRKGRSCVYPAIFTGIAGGVGPRQAGLRPLAPYFGRLRPHFPDRTRRDRGVCGDRFEGSVPFTRCGDLATRRRPRQSAAGRAMMGVPGRWWLLFVAGSCAVLRPVQEFRGARPISSAASSRGLREAAFPDDVSPASTRGPVARLVGGRSTAGGLGAALGLADRLRQRS